METELQTTDSQPLAIVPHDVSAVAMEMAIGMGDFQKLTSSDRLNYIGKLCQYVGLNPLTKPIDIINIGGKVVLYANKSCAEQLRGLHKISITITERIMQDGCYIVRARGRMPDGREDESIGAVPCFEKAAPADRANAMMKAETKAKRRVSLSLVGLGFIPDETELDTMKPAQVSGVMDTGETAGDRGAQLLELSKETLSTAVGKTEDAETSQAGKGNVTERSVATATPDLGHSPGAGSPRVESQPAEPMTKPATATVPPAVHTSGAAPSVFLPDSKVAEIIAALDKVPQTDKHNGKDCIDFLIARGHLAKGASLNTIAPQMADRLITKSGTFHRNVEAWKNQGSL